MIGGALGGVIGVPLTLVVASFGMLLGFPWPLLSPVRGCSADILVPLGRVRRL